MKLKTTTWILAAALIGVAAYFFLVEEKGRAADERERRENTKLLPYEMKDVARFTLINPQGERIEVTHEGAGWKVVYPVQAPGDEPMITAFIGQVVPGRRRETIESPRASADYGLEKPFATLIVERRGAAAPDTLFVGDKTPTSASAYVRIGGAGAVLVSGELTHNVMNKNLFHLRDKNFLALKSDSITALAIHTAKETIDVKREGKYWWFAEPRVRADRAVIESYLTKLTMGIIYGFVREDLDTLAPYGLDRPACEVDLVSGGHTTRVAFGSTNDDKVHVMRTGLDKIVLLDGSLLEAAGWTRANMRAMNLAFFDDDSVRTVRWETPDTSVALKKSRSKWSTTGADTASIRSWEVSSLLRRIGDTTFERITAEPLAGAGPPPSAYLLRVTLEDWKETVLDRITITGTARGGIAGASLSANAAGSLPRSALDELDANFKRIGKPAGKQ